MQFEDDNNYKNNNNQGTVGNGHDNILCDSNHCKFW